MILRFYDLYINRLNLNEAWDLALWHRKMMCDPIYEVNVA